jgi:hypothetical protein
MKANTRQMSGSTRSRRTPLPRFATPARRFQTLPEECVHYAYKMRPNFKTKILITLASVTYNCVAQKCTHSPVPRALLLLAIPARRTRSPNSMIVAFQRTAEGGPFSLGEKVRMRAKLVPAFSRAANWYTVRTPSQDRIEMQPPFPNHAPARSSGESKSRRIRVDSCSFVVGSQNRTKQNDFKLRSISPTPYQRLTTMPVPVVRFLERGISLELGDWNLAFRAALVPAFLDSSEIRGAETSTKCVHFEYKRVGGGTKSSLTF